MKLVIYFLWTLGNKRLDLRFGLTWQAVDIVRYILQGKSSRVTHPISSAVILGVGSGGRARLLCCGRGILRLIGICLSGMLVVSRLFEASGRLVKVSRGILGATGAILVDMVPWILGWLMSPCRGIIAGAFDGGGTLSLSNCCWRLVRAILTVATMFLWCTWRVAMTPCMGAWCPHVGDIGIGRVWSTGSDWVLARINRRTLHYNIYGWSPSQDAVTIRSLGECLGVGTNKEGARAQRKFRGTWID